MTDYTSSSVDAVPVSVREHALFLDFDGTLAPLQDDPEAVALPAFGPETLRALHACFDGALVLISGRDVRDLSVRTPSALWRAGGHGLEICAPDEMPGSDWQRIDADLLAQTTEIVTPFDGRPDRRERPGFGHSLPAESAG